MPVDVAGNIEGRNHLCSGRRRSLAGASRVDVASEPLRSRRMIGVVLVEQGDEDVDVEEPQLPFSGNSGREQRAPSSWAGERQTGYPWLCIVDWTVSGRGM